MVTKLADKYCRSCICWAVCKLGMKEECNVCNTCPTDIGFYEGKCSKECSIRPNIKTYDNAVSCLDCLQTTVPDTCAQEEPITTATCSTSSICTSEIKDCKICILSIYYAVTKCVALNGEPGLTTECMVGYLTDIQYTHCIDCVCWALCTMRMDAECEWCKQNP